MTVERRARVLEIINESSLGGGQSQLLSLATGLPASRFDVTIASAPGGPLVAAAHEAGIPFVEIPFDAGNPPRLLLSLRSLLREQRFDLVHTHGGIAGLWARLAAAGSGASTVHTFHGIHYLHFENRLRAQAYRLVDRALVPLTDRFVCVCRSDAARAVDAGVARADRVRVVHNGIEAGPPASAEVRRAARSELSLADGEVAIGCVARLHRQKGIDHLLAASIRPELAALPCSILLVGGGEEESRLRARAQSLGASRVRFLGPRGDVDRLLAAFDVFCLPSLWEGLPIVLLEALIHELPTVATAVDGTVEVVDDGVHALLVPPADPAALARALATLVSDRSLAARLGTRGRQRVLDGFTRARMVDATAAVYDELLATRASAGSASVTSSS